MGELAYCPRTTCFPNQNELTACLIAFFRCATPGTGPILISTLPFEVQCLNSPQVALPT